LQNKGNRRAIGQGVKIKGRVISKSNIFKLRISLDLESGNQEINGNYDASY
jgi:hypothetical protein